MTKLSTII